MKNKTLNKKQKVIKLTYNLILLIFVLIVVLNNKDNLQIRNIKVEDNNVSSSTENKLTILDKQTATLKNDYNFQINELKNGNLACSGYKKDNEIFVVFEDNTYQILEENQLNTICEDIDNYYFKFTDMFRLTNSRTGLITKINGTYKYHYEINGVIYEFDANASKYLNISVADGKYNYQIHFN